MAGATPALVRVDGLDSLRPIAATQFDFTTHDLEICRNLVTIREAARQAKQDPQVFSIGQSLHEPTLNSKLLDWANAQWAPIDKRGVAAYFDSHSQPYDVEAAATVANHKLFVVWKTGDSQLLQNSGEFEEMIFKTGGALDLMLSTGLGSNLRLLVTKVHDQTKAMLYRDSQVSDVSKQITLMVDGQGDYELVVPLELIGLNPMNDGIKGDIGILRGDGKQTVERVYWHNKATALVSDVPSEARLTPELWGIWHFNKQ